MTATKNPTFRTQVVYVREGGVGSTRFVYLAEFHTTEDAREFAGIQIGKGRAVLVCDEYRGPVVEMGK